MQKQLFAAWQVLLLRLAVPSLPRGVTIPLSNKQFISEMTVYPNVFNSTHPTLGLYPFMSLFFMLYFPDTTSTRLSSPYHCCLLYPGPLGYLIWTRSSSPSNFPQTSHQMHPQNLNLGVELSISRFLQMKNHCQALTRHTKKSDLCNNLQHFSIITLISLIMQ